MHLHYNIKDSQDFAPYAFQTYSAYWDLHYENELHALESASWAQWAMQKAVHMSFHSRKALRSKKMFLEMQTGHAK
jgi:hypothetical protein